MGWKEGFNDLKTVLTKPSKFFKHYKEKGFERTFWFMLSLAAINIVLGTIVYIFYGSIKDPFGIFMLALTGLLWIIASSFIGTGLLFIWCILWGGKGSFGETFQLAIYAGVPLFVFGWIPYVRMVAWIYTMILLIIGTELVHKIPSQRSLLMYLIPIIVLLLASILGLVYFLDIANSQQTI